MDRLPQLLRDVVEEFSKLPGLGPKSSLKIALTLLKWPKEEVFQFADVVVRLKDSLFLCEICGNITDENPCKICKDPARDDRLLCVVADLDSLLAIEESGLFKGKFLVLGGLVSPLDGFNIEDSALDKLRKRLKEGIVKEVILALGTTKESELTESYVVEIVKKEFPHVLISRLAQGIPVGMMLKYVDSETLKQSFNFRQRL